MNDETCADCGKPIYGNQGSYYKKAPHEDIGRAFHSECGDPFGIKAKDAEIERLQEVVRATEAARMGGLEQIAELREKIERLRAALTEVQMEIPAGKVPGWYGECFQAIREIVDEALKDEQSGDGK